MIFLELTFDYDRESTVIGSILSDEETLSSTRQFRVMGISALHVGHSDARGGMVRAFYEYADERVRGKAISLDEFRSNLYWAFRAATGGGTLDPQLMEWLQEIDPYIEDSEGGHAVIRPGTSIRFYHPNGSEGSWVWKDTVKTVKAILCPL